MNTSKLVGVQNKSNVMPLLVNTTRKKTGLKSIDQLITRHGICLSDNAKMMADNPFQKSLVLYGQDQRLDYMKLPPCMYMIISEASVEEEFVVHRFYLPYKNGIRFATYLLNADGDIVESVCYQRNAKYLTAFKVIRSEISLACNLQGSLVA